MSLKMPAKMSKLDNNSIAAGPHSEHNMHCTMHMCVMRRVSFSFSYFRNDGHECVTHVVCSKRILQHRLTLLNVVNLQLGRSKNKSNKKHRVHMLFSILAPTNYKFNCGVAHLMRCKCESVSYTWFAQIDRAQGRSRNYRNLGKGI